MKATLGICLVTRDQGLIEDVSFAIEQLQAGLQPHPSAADWPSEILGCEEMHRALGPRPRSEEVLETLMVQVQRYLQGCVASRAALPDLWVMAFGSFKEAQAQLRMQGSQLSSEMFILDFGEQLEAGAVIRLTSLLLQQLIRVCHPIRRCYIAVCQPCRDG